jgi:hypothetical protein
MFILLNDPFYFSTQIYHFFNSHEMFELMPIVEKFRKINQISFMQSHEELIFSRSEDILRQSARSVDETLRLRGEQTALEFIEFQVFCNEIEQKIEIIDDLPIQSHKLQIVKTFKL